MRNLLRQDYLIAFNGTDKAHENLSGGVALWDTPARMSCAFNSLMFTRTKYLHRVAEYVPKQRTQPNFIHIDNSTVELFFDFSTKASLYVNITTDAGPLVCVIGTGNTRWKLSTLCTRILSVDSVSYSKDTTHDYVTDSSYIYIREGYAYSDREFVCSPSGDVLFKNYAVETTQLNVYKYDGTYKQLSAESFNGVTKFDAAAVVKSWLAENLADFKEEDEAVEDHALFTTYKIKGIGGTSYAQTFVAVNAVAQIGESPDREPYSGKALTLFPHLSYYDGYPLDYAILSGAVAPVSARTVISPESVTRVRVDGRELVLQNEAGEAILTESGEAIRLLPAFDVPVVGKCTPDRPFYVRWINRLGGVEYFMFARQQKLSSAVKSVSVYSPFVERTDRAKSNSRAYAIAAERLITVGTDNLSKQERRALDSLPFAPTIEWYNEKTGSWLSLVVSKFDSPDYTNDSTKSFEITFALPTLNTQF